MVGNSNANGQVSQFFEHKSIFVTGATGFIGKVLVHKLLSSCPTFEKLYLLIRCKKGLNPQERLKNLLKLPIFETVKDLSMLSKIVVVPGYISLPKLGLSDTDITSLSKHVSVIFHCAATVRFDEDLSK